MIPQINSRTMPYIERDESWMYFNRRILMEARREDIPLLERVNYLGIYSNNLDEFFRVRIASLKRILEYGVDVPTIRRKKTINCIKKILTLNEEYNALFEDTWDKIVNLLHREHIHIINETELSETQRKEVLSFYMTHLNGVTNPIFVDSPTFITDHHLKEVLYLAVEMRKHGQSDTDSQMSIIEIPVKEFGRFIRLKESEGESFIMFIDDIIRFCLPFIFTGVDYDEYRAYTFQFTKDAEIEIETDLRSSVLEKVRLGVKKRKQGNPIRLLYEEDMPSYMLFKLSRMAEFNNKDTFVKSRRYQNMRDLMKFPDCGRKDLRDKPQPPIMLSELQYSKSILQEIYKRDKGIHLPYFSFDHFLRILREAAISKDVESISVTLYRLAQNSKVVKALVAAAQNGKRVTAVVEIMARFDETSNINWSKKMQEAGVKVVFGHEKIKVHSKIVLIRTANKSIACIGSGNMHEGTARIYTDYMLITSNKRITDDVAKVFNFIEKPFLNVRFNELLVSPNEMRRKLYVLINKEIKNAQQGKEAFIKIKINHIVDEKMVKKLYEASNAGVKIELCLRGNCSIIPGVKGFSENISINGIIDRYLEHSRIYIFCNGGNNRYYIGSADWMTRNLDRRIEVLVPVYDQEIQKDLYNIVEAGIKDNNNGYYVNTNNGNPRRIDIPENEKLYRSQEQLYLHYKAKYQE